MSIGLTRASLRLVGISILVALLASVLPACVHHHHHAASPAAKAKKGGPPPWAPAQGYRHKHAQGVDLVFNAGFGVYVVVGYENHYFSREHFYRGSGSDWQMSTHIRGSWISIDVSRLPSGLAARSGKKHRGHAAPPPAKQGKGRGPKW